MLIKAICCYSIVLSLIVTGCQQQNAAIESDTVFTHRDSGMVSITYLFLPDSNRTCLAITRDTVWISKQNSRDSVLTADTVALHDSLQSSIDSLFLIAAKIRPGLYDKPNVLDGTVIWIYHQLDTIICDNCLHNFVMQESGVPAPGASVNVRRIRNLVGCASNISMRAAPPPKKTYRRLFVRYPDTASDSDTDYTIDIQTDPIKVSP